ncbi:MAG TPA: hypothetical protein ENK18_14690 [Deltaproteobacteria bacterium]|nr:hypothetical protein [Deltaproteobacteria bacterium]
MLTLILLSCTQDDPEPLDLGARLGPGEARAGFITDESVLFAGICAEGQAGDVMLVNDRVRFVVQGVRRGSWYLPQGGTVIDADIVRPEGALGRDMVEEWSPVLGFGRVLVPEAIEIVSDGRRGGAAVVRVHGREGALGLVEGAVEVAGFVPDLGLRMVTEYVLPPDQWLMEVRTTVMGADPGQPLAVGDVLIAAQEISRAFGPGAGLGRPATPDPFAWTGVISDRNDVALVVAAPAGEELTSAGGELLTELADMVVAYGDDLDLSQGGDTRIRYYGVGPDLATLSDAVLGLHQLPTQELSGQVMAAGVPVAGARVNLLADGQPSTIAVTDEEGRYAGGVPAGAIGSVEVVGRGPALFVDLPGGAPSYSPYAAPVVRQRVLDALEQGSSGSPRVEGRGLAAEGSHELGIPATLELHSDDGAPFAVRLGFVQPDPLTEPTRVPPRPDGLVAAGWSRDGEITLEVEPGTYELLAHRGPRFELHLETVELQPGATVVRDVSLPSAFEHPGWLLADPHMHAAPSPDADVPMADRLIGAAALGLQVHFGTDHDHLADYRPLLAALGLSKTLSSVVSDEVSPPLRGHFNIYPVEPTEAPNGGAWPWWIEIPQSTEAMVDRLRELHGPDFVLQSNHPTDSGVATAARWDPGTVGDGSHWTDRLEAVEVLNSGHHDEFFEFWLDLALRGYATSPVGVSDSHGHFAGHVGLSATWLGVGTDDPGTLPPEAVADAVRTGRTVPSLGPFLELSIEPNRTLVGPSTLEVTAHSASWVQIDRLILLEDGVEVARVADTTASFELTPERDALFVVIAEGDQPMSPISTRSPWAMAGPYRVDLDGDGWTPPLPALSVNP